MTSNKKKLTILVATHKPCFVPDTKTFQLIHCGKAISKLDKKSLKWMESNTIGDDTGDNISRLNPYFCELTAIYWAWKNYEQLGDPERIGLCHYRRYFMDLGTENEITVPVHYLTESIAEQFKRHHHQTYLDNAIRLLPNEELRECVLEYLQQKKGYFFNMFVFPKDVFFSYCEILFNTLFKLSEISHWETLDDYQKRMPGFIAERLTGGFIYYLQKEKNYLIHRSLAVVPIFNSYSQLRLQAGLTACLVRSIPKFDYLYSRFLSVQTHLMKH